MDEANPWLDGKLENAKVLVGVFVGVRQISIG